MSDAAGSPSLSSSKTSAPPSTLQEEAAYQEDNEDEATRVLRFSSEMDLGAPTLRHLSATAATSAPLRGLEPESFVPPAAFVTDSLSPTRLVHEAPTPLPARHQDLPSEGSEAPALRAEYESEAPTGQLPPQGFPLASSALRAPALPSLDAPPAPNDVAPADSAGGEASAAPSALSASIDPADSAGRKAWIARAEWLES
jgi:hypothetical protein